MVNKALTYDLIVDNALILYKFLNKYLGKRISNSIIERTIGKVFTAGTNLQSVENLILNSGSNIKFMLDYCSEALEDLEDPEKFFEDNAQIFRNTTLSCAKYPNSSNMIAIKVSALINRDVLIKLSKAEDRIHAFISQECKIEEIFKKLEQEGLILSQQERCELITDVFNKESDQSIISPTEWRYLIKSAYIYDDHMNLYRTIQHFNQLNEFEFQLFRNFQRRSRYFIDLAGTLNVKILVDAEQTYLQQAIDSFSEQMERQHNNNYKIIIYNTIQNYLKSAEQRIDYEVSKAKRFNRPIALKMVRGAYMVEEKQISTKLQIQNPICDTYEATTQMYNCNLNKIMSFRDSLHSSVVIASHNEATVEKTKQILDEKNIPRNQDEIIFAQLFGLSDHLTYSLQNQQYQVYKYIPFGQTDIMIPYLIRRAQESRKMLSSNRLQSALLMDEIKQRIFTQTNQ